MTDFRKFCPWKHTTRKRFTKAPHWALFGVILMAFFLAGGNENAEAFVQKAVDRLRETNKCMRCDLRAADLAGKDLRSVKLMGAYLIGANLAGANLAGADLRGAWLTRANLQRANLEGADLRGAHLMYADLTSANLQRIDLQNARLGRAILTGSTLKKANLSGANLQTSKLNRVRHLEQKQVDKACGDAETVLPQGISIPLCHSNTR